MKPKDQLIKELEKLKTHKGIEILGMEGATEIINAKIDHAISTIKSFIKDYEMIPKSEMTARRFIDYCLKIGVNAELENCVVMKKSEWINQFMKAHNLKTYDEAIDKLCECYRAWTIQTQKAVAGNYKMVKKTDYDSLKSSASHLQKRLIKAKKRATEYMKCNNSRKEQLARVSKWVDKLVIDGRVTGKELKKVFPTKHSIKGDKHE